MVRLLGVRREGGWWVKYNEDKSQFPFPPVDSNVRVLRASAQLRQFRRVRPLQIEIPLGHRVRVSFNYRDEPSLIRSWIGSVVGYQAHGVLVRYDHSPRLFTLPPPSSANVHVHSVHSFARPPSTLRQETLRFRRAAAFAALSLHSCSEHEAHDHLFRQVNTQLERPFTVQHPTLNKGLCLASFNARTLTDRAKLHSLCGWMDSQRIHLCAVQETRLRADVPEEELQLRGGYTFVHSCADERGVGGVGLFISPQLQNDFVNSTVVVKSRCILVSFRKFNIIVAYAPTAPHEQEREEFFQALIQPIQNSGSLPIFSLGDWNASLLSSQHLRGKCLAASVQFEDFLSVADFVSAQQCVQNHITTFECRAIDHILVPRRFLSGVLSLHARHPPVLSDHSAVVAVVKTRWCTEKKERQKKSFCIDQVAYDGNQRHLLDSQFFCLWNTHAIHDYNNFCECA